MDSKRFDSLTRIVALRSSRRGLIAAGLGLATAPVLTRTMAQEATPASTPTGDPHQSADDATTDPEFLFVQPFDSGTWSPKEGEEGVFVLTLSGTDAHTIYFSDRPERITGLAPMQQFLDGLGFTPANPPNAAIVAQRADGPGADGSEQEVLLIELFNPVYDADAGTLSYDARVLADYGEPGLAHLAREQRDYELGEDFGEGSLFIDDCASGTATCETEHGVPIGSMSIGCCWNWSNLACGGCKSAGTAYAGNCADAYPDQCGDGTCKSGRSLDCSTF